MKTNSARLLFLAIIVLIFIAYSLAVADDFYRDPNGLYSFVPPRSWTKKTFSDPRSKVEYVDPSAPNNSVVIITGAMEQTSIVEFKERKNRLKKIFPGANITTKEVKVVGETAVKHSMDHFSQQYELVMFWKNGYEYSISFGTKDKATLQKLSPVFQAALDSFKVASPSTPTKAEIQRSQCANWLRLVEIFREHRMDEDATHSARLANQAECRK